MSTIEEIRKLGFNVSSVDESNPSCLCGCLKVILSSLCPLYVVVSCGCGACMTFGACLKCECTSEKFLEQRNVICSCCGISTGGAVSLGLLSSGFREMRKSLCVTSDMKR